MPAPPTVLLIDDDPDLVRPLDRALAEVDPSFVLEVAATVREGEAAIAERPVACVLLDYRLPDASGLDFLRRLKHVAPHVPVVMLTASDSTEVAVEAMKLGARDYVVKVGRYPRMAARKVREVLGKDVLARAARRAESPPPDAGDRTRGEPSRIDGIVGDSVLLAEAVALVRRAARSSIPVLLEGESGVGKELFARAIHAESPRRDRRFVAQNCAALQDALLESELFGHVKGAFTGADRDRAGLFEAATGGTIFLDEVSEASPAIQAKLLRVLQEREIRPLGATAARTVDVRLVSAANVDLAAAVRDGRFRQDLYYRMRVFPIRVPPLRERSGDVSLLVRHFVATFAAQENVPPPDVTPEALQAFERYAWPGNVRELENEIHRLVLCVDPGSPIGVDALSPTILAARGVESDPERPLKSIVEDIELATIVERLREHGYNREATAKSLGLTREALWKKMRKLGLEVSRRGPDGDEE